MFTHRLRTPSLLIVAALGLAACASEEERAQAVLEDYLEAELEGDRARAWELIATEDRRRMDRAEFLKVDPIEEAVREKYVDVITTEVTSVIVREIEAEAVVKATGPDLARMKDTPGDEVLTRQEFKTYTLVREGEDWRVDVNLGAEVDLSGLESLVGLFFGEEVIKETLGLGRDMVEAYREGVEAFRDMNEAIRDTAPSSPGSPPPSPTTDAPPTPPTDTPPTPPTAPPTAPTVPPTIPQPPDGPVGTDTLERLLEDAERLLEDVAGPQPGATPGAPAAGGWVVTQGADPMTDAPVTTLTLRSPRALGEVVPRHPVLTVQCKGGEVSLSARVYMLVTSNFGERDHASVEVRVGDDPIAQVGVWLSGAHQTMSLEEPKRWLARMKATGGPLRIGFTAPVRERHVAWFELDGVEEALARLPEACRP